MRALRLCPRPKGSGSAVHPVGCVTTTFPANHHGCFPECTDPSKPGAPKMQSQKTLSLIWPPDFIWLVVSKIFQLFPIFQFSHPKQPPFPCFLPPAATNPSVIRCFLLPAWLKKAQRHRPPRQRSTTARHGAALRPAPRRQRQRRHGAPRAEDAQQPPAGDR